MEGASTRKKFRPDEPIEFQHADAMALPFADASFDAVRAIDCSYD